MLVLNQFAVPRTQGGGTRHVELFGSMARWSHLIIAGGRNYTSQEVYELREPGFVTVAVPPANGAAWARAVSWGTYVVRATLRGLRLGPFDVVYASTPHLLVPVAGHLLAKTRRVPLVVEVRDLWPESAAAAAIVDRRSLTFRLLEALERWIYAQADAVVAVTPGWENHFERCGVPRSKQHVVTNGAEVDDFEVHESREELRDELGISGFAAVFAGAHGPMNALDHILDAARACPDIQFLLMGSGPSKRGARERAQRERIGNVTFRDPVPKRDLPRILKACDVGIHAITPLSVLEHGMSPNKLFDYLAAGLPVVSNAQNPLRRVLAQGECGVLGGPDSLADSLRGVRDASPEQRAAWGERGRAIMRERYSRAARAGRLAGVLDSVVSSAERQGS